MTNTFVVANIKSNPSLIDSNITTLDDLRKMKKLSYKDIVVSCFFALSMLVVFSGLDSKMSVDTVSNKMTIGLNNIKNQNNNYISKK